MDARIPKVIRVETLPKQRLLIDGEEFPYAIEAGSLMVGTDDIPRLSLTMFADKVEVVDTEREVT